MDPMDDVDGDDGFNDHVDTLLEELRETGVIVDPPHEAGDVEQCTHCDDHEPGECPACDGTGWQYFPQ